MDGCCLTCSVRPQEAENFAVFECQREVIESCMCAVMFACALKLQSSGHSGILSREDLSESAEELAQVLRQQFRLLHCGEVASSWHLRPANDVQTAFGKLARRQGNFPGKCRECY